jgi:hypothetical protein
MSRKGVAREIVDAVLEAVSHEHGVVTLSAEGMKSLLKKVTRKINEANKAAAMAA